MSLFTRRNILQRSAVGFGYLAAMSMLQDEHAAQAAADPLAPKTPHFPPRAKRVIFLFMKGGPSQVDTFDYKPQLQKMDGKELPFDKPRVQFAATGKLLKSPWRFRQHGESGLWASELFPNVAKHVDDLCILSSVHGTNAAHGGALLKLHTGSDNFVRPSMGAWVSYGLGTENRSLPAFVTICPTLAHGGVKNWGSAFLPAWTQGTPIGNASVPAEQARVKYITTDRLSRDEQRRRLDLLAEINRADLEQSGPNAALEARISSFELAFRMQGEMPRIQDLSDESKSTIEMYGINDKVTSDFGRQCLMARRFSERGVRFVQVTHSDDKVQWDQHSNLKSGHEEKASEVDRPIAALLTDLKERGLLDDTLVMWGGEFGRTPVAQGKNGRDHNPEGFTMWMAGAGVKRGFKYGSTDDFGYYAIENKMHVNDLHATLLHLLGMDHLQLTYRYAGRDFRLTDIAGHVAHDILA
ncbi:MAG: DUF1501 domain-containing protein [Planctomycetota bacterium]|jgi:hypothetical protein